MKLECNTGYSLCSKRFRLVSGQRNTKEGGGRGLSVLTAREMKREPKSDPALLLAPLFSRSLTLVPRSFLLNRTETLATQAILGISLLSISRLKKINISKSSDQTKKSGKNASPRNTAHI